MACCGALQLVCSFGVSGFMVQSSKQPDQVGRSFLHTHSMQQSPAQARLAPAAQGQMESQEGRSKKAAESDVRSLIRAVDNKCMNALKETMTAAKEILERSPDAYYSLNDEQKRTLLF